MFPVDDVVLVAPPLAELAALEVWEPLGAADGGCVAGICVEAGVRAGDLEPLAQEASIVAGLQANLRFSDLTERLAVGEDLRHSARQPVGDSPSREGKQRLGAGGETQIG